MLSFVYVFVEAAQQRIEEVGDDAAAVFQHPINSIWTGLPEEPCAANRDGRDPAERFPNTCDRWA